MDVASNVHYGSRFTFDRDGYLYFSIGDCGRAERAQDLSAPVGKIHRVADDGRPAPGNPFANQAGALASVWSYGNRNPRGSRGIRSPESSGRPNMARAAATR